MALNSGYTWEPDPAGNGNAQAGRTDGTWVRAKEDPRVAALAKSPPRDVPREIYTMGMERVASTLGRRLGLPIPRVWLDRVLGKRAAVVERIEGLTWSMAFDAVADRVTDRSVWPTCVVFDVWIANVDRVPRNLQLAPEPDGIRFPIAESYRLWLIDHGMSGLYWSSKFDPSLPEDRPDRVVVGDGEMTPIFEQRLRRRMPRDYQTAYWASTDAERNAALDAIRSVTDDEIDAAVNEIPNCYMSAVERAKTSGLLRARRDTITTLMTSHW